MKKYTTPEIKIDKFISEDIITSSGVKQQMIDEGYNEDNIWSLHL